MSYVLAAVVVIASLTYIVVRGRSRFGNEYSRLRLAAVAQSSQSPMPVLTEQDISSLPAPVQRYLRVTGSMNKARIKNVQVSYDAELIQKPGQRGRPGPAEQFDCFDPPKRLFFMRSRMYGLPVAVLHHYEGIRASMKVRIASLFNVVDSHGDELARTETVTLLNDLCFLAPCWLADERLSWRQIDDFQTEVVFTNGPHRVSAILVFDDAGDLVNFISQDRGVFQSDGSLKNFRWSTPMRTYRDFDGRRVATQGEAIWHYPEGDFVYGRFTLKTIRFDATS
jgi:hypothetical protein